MLELQLKFIEECIANQLLIYDLMVLKSNWIYVYNIENEGQWHVQGGRGGSGCSSTPLSSGIAARSVA